MTNLIAPLLWATVVALVLWPRIAGRRLGFSVYVLTITINELPLWFLVAISFGIWAGADDRPDGAAGAAWIALWAFVVGGLLWAQFRAGRAHPALWQALTASWGEQRPEADDVDRRRVLRAWLRGIALPFQRRTPGVERTRDLSYGPDPAHILDAYRGPRPGGGRPILIHFHEGGFIQGNKSRESVTLLNQLAAHGWWCLSANYRLRADAAWPNPLIDAKRAIAWAREHAAENGADADQVFLAGGSAGGHMALNAALTAGDPRFQPGFERADTSVLAAVSLYGYLGGRSDDPASSPTDLAGADSPPLLLIQGANDTGMGAPIDTIRGWATKLQAKSAAPVVYAELPGAQHAFDLFASVRARLTADAVEDFLRWARRQRLGTVE